MKSDPKPFEMPFDRLLSDSEKLMLEVKGLEFEWVNCLACSNSGWTIDGRKYCSLKCYCREHGLNDKSIALIKKAVFLDEAACEGDQVIYDDCLMKVVATDCTKKRIKRGYNLKYNYVLDYNGRTIVLKDLDTPLRKSEMNSFTDSMKYENRRTNWRIIRTGIIKDLNSKIELFKFNPNNELSDQIRNMMHYLREVNSIS